MPQPPRSTAAPPQPPAGATAAAVAAPDVAAALSPALAAVVARVLTAAAAKKVAEALTKALLAAAETRRQGIDLLLDPMLKASFPERSDAERARAIANERRFEAEYRRKLVERLKADLPTALAIEDPEQRKAAIAAIVDREKRYAQQREDAIQTRAIAFMERINLRELSPEGAYWKLSPHVKEHTLDCLFMGEKFWPWEVLDKIHPPLHAGCPCELYGLDEAVRRGLMTHDQVPEKRDAIRRANRLMKAAEQMGGELQEAAIAEYIDWALGELALTEATIRKGDIVHRKDQPGKHGRVVDHPQTLVKGQGESVTVEWQDGILSHPADSLEHSDRPGADWVGPPDAIREAELRWAKGYHRGGEFRPKLGGSPGARILKDLLGSPKSPLRKRGEKHGRHHWINGVYTHVPEATRWERHRGGHHYVSPPGTTDVYRDGALMDAPEKSAPRMPALTRPETAKATQALRTSGRREALRRAQGAAARLSPAHEPLHAGDGPEAVLALRDAGFEVDQAEPRGGDTLLHFHHGQTDAQLEVRWDGRNVVGVDWRPHPPRPKRQASEGAPADFGAAVSDTLAWADEVGKRFGADVQVPNIAGSARFEDHAGQHSWTGEVSVGPDVARDLNVAGAARAEGRPLKEQELRGVYSATHVLAHEAVGHGVNPISPQDWENDAHEHLEEALAEEAAHVLATERLTEQGQHDVLAWRDRNQDSLPVQGVYRGARDSLAGLFDLAGVKDPVARHDLVMRLKYETPPGKRLDVLTDLIHKQHPELDRADAYDHVELTMADPSVRDETRPVIPFMPKSPGYTQVGTVGYGRFGGAELTQDGHSLLLPNGARRVLEKRPMPLAMREQVPEFPVDSDGNAWAVVHYPPGARSSDDFRFVDTQARGKRILRGWTGKGRPATEDVQHLLAPETQPPQHPGYGQKSFWDELKAGLHFGYPGGKKDGERPTKKPKPPPKPIVLGGNADAPAPTGPIPSYDRIRLEVGKPAGGSTGARFAKDEEGSRWLVKTYKGDQDRVATELLANAIYREMGAKVARAGTMDTPDGGLALAYETLPGKTQRIKEPSAELGKHYMTDALLANWDFIGLTDDNVLWDNGEPFRVDQGGTGFFRAQGGPKPFGPVPTEVWTLQSPKGQGFGKVEVSEPEMRAQASAIAKKLTPAKIDSLVDKSHFADPRLREETRTALKARVGWMKQFAEGKADVPSPPTGAEARAVLTQSQADFHPYPEQENALYHYATDAGAINSVLRERVPKAETPPEVANTIKELDSILRHVHTDEDTYLYTGLDMDPQIAASPDLEGMVGKTFAERGFLNLTTDEQKARNKPTVLRVLLPAGSSALYLHGVNGLEPMPPDPEVIVRRGQRMRIVGRVQKDGKVYVEALAL